MTAPDSNIHPFAQFVKDAWPYRFRVGLHIDNLHGGTPRNADVVRSWLRAKAGWTDEMQIEAEVQRIFTARPTASDAEVTTEAVADLADKHVNGFPRDEHGLYLPGRCLKSGIKEMGSVALASGAIKRRYGETNKGVLSFIAEHVMVVEDRLYLGRDEHDDLHTRFVVSRWGTGITVEEVCYDVKLTATVISDYDFTPREWAVMWLKGEQQGLGASRSQGFGRYTVTEWVPL